MKVLLVKNFGPDMQESMLRFADCLARELPSRGVEVEVIDPQPRLSRDAATGGAKKWLGYVDKFINFRTHLRRVISDSPTDTIIHICDHSNSAYVNEAQGRPTLVTCHDLLAVRGAAGDAEVRCAARPTGKLLQRWIVRNLARADAIICDSTSTAADLAKFVPHRKGWSDVVLLGLNEHFERLTQSETIARLAFINGLRNSIPYLLIVGSAHPRKNRETALRVFAQWRQKTSGQLVIAGEPLNDNQRSIARELKIADDIIQLPNVSHSTLEALYNGAFALFFPSWAEGFGWPVLEAQACGCPVICSDRTSLPEVSGAAAFLRAPSDEGGFLNDLFSLADPGVRKQYAEAGIQNAARLSVSRMIDGYVNAYERLLAKDVQAIVQRGA